MVVKEEAILVWQIYNWFTKGRRLLHNQLNYAFDCVSIWFPSQTWIIAWLNPELSTSPFRLGKNTIHNLCSAWSNGATTLSIMLMRGLKFHRSCLAFQYSPLLSIFFDCCIWIKIILNGMERVCIGNTILYADYRTTIAQTRLGPIWSVTSKNRNFSKKLTIWIRNQVCDKNDAI